MKLEVEELGLLILVLADGIGGFFIQVEVEACKHDKCDFNIHHMMIISLTLKLCQSC